MVQGRHVPALPSPPLDFQKKVVSILIPEKEINHPQVAAVQMRRRSCAAFAGGHAAQEDRMDRTEASHRLEPGCQNEGDPGAMENCGGLKGRFQMRAAT